MTLNPKNLLHKDGILSMIKVMENILIVVVEIILQLNLRLK